MISWKLHQKGSPKEHSNGIVAPVAVRHKLYYFGRNTENNKHQIDVQVFNTVTLLWRKFTPVTPIGESIPEVLSRGSGYTALLIEDIVYFLGGSECVLEKYCNHFYAFDVDAHTWSKPQVSGIVPEGRCSHSACVLGKVMYIHGGYNSRTGSTSDMHKLDTATMVRSLINTRGFLPPASSQHSATIIGTKMFVFGGCFGSVYQNTIRVFDTETNHWLNTSSAQFLPEACDYHIAFTHNGELYIFGGCYHNPTDNDNFMWKFSPETFSWKKVETKGKGLDRMKRCCCMMGDRIILYGGKETPDDLYVLDFSPSLKTLCKLAFIQYGLDQSELPHNIRWELSA